MISRMMISLNESERKALQQIAEAEIRGMRDQARYILRKELERRGLIDAKESTSFKDKASDDN